MLDCPSPSQESACKQPGTPLFWRTESAYTFLVRTWHRLIFPPAALPPPL